MKEIKEAMSILRARWPEAVVIVSLYALIDAVPRLLRSAATDPRKGTVWYFVPLILLIIATVLKYGFLRTVHLDGRQRQTIPTLYYAGRKFFSRIVGYGLIYSICYCVLIWLAFLAIKHLASIETSLLGTMKSSPSLFLLCVTVPTVVLIKIQLLVPAIILVRDCGLFESFKSLRKRKLLDSKALVALFCLSLVLTVIWGLARVRLAPDGILLYVASSIYAIGTQVLWIIIAVAAVRFVGALELADAATPPPPL